MNPLQHLSSVSAWPSSNSAPLRTVKLHSPTSGTSAFRADSFAAKPETRQQRKFPLEASAVAAVAASVEVVGVVAGVAVSEAAVEAEADSEVVGAAGLLLLARRLTSTVTPTEHPTVNSFKTVLLSHSLPHTLELLFHWKNVWSRVKIGRL